MATFEILGLFTNEPLLVKELAVVFFEGKS